MKRLVQVSAATMLLASAILTGCSQDKPANNAAEASATGSPSPSPTVSPAVTPLATASASKPVSEKLNEAKFAGLEESIAVKTASITIDGNEDDWSGLDSYEVTKNTEGMDLANKAQFVIAWDGKQTLFVKGTLSAPGPFLAAQKKESTEWWSDDILEVFLTPALPEDEAKNKALTDHYALSTKEVFVGSADLSANSAKVTSKNISLKDGEWTVEMAIPLEGANLEAVKNGSIYSKVAIELNSGKEYSLLGRTGGFWDVDNFIKFTFE